MICSNVVNNNGGAAITTNGNYCAISAGGTSFGAAGGNVIDSASYFFQTGAGVTAGSVSVGILLANGTWVVATTPNSATGAAFTLVATLAANAIYNGSFFVAGAIFVPIDGIRLVVAGLTGGNITYAQLVGTMR